MIADLNWARSLENQAIHLYSNSQFSELDRPVLFIGGIHGDEPEGIWLAEEFLDWAQSHETIHPWMAIPCLNPDGYAKNQRTNSRGVDLNRNFPSDNWSHQFSKERYNPGLSPNSEPEVKALVSLIKETKLSLIIHFHSWEPGIIYTGDSAKPQATYFAESTGYDLKEDIGYPTPGSLGEYGRTVGIPVICLEEQEGSSREDIFPRFRFGFEKLLLY